MEAPRGRGRPKKTDDQGTPEQVKKRNYMRNYTNQIKEGIEKLELDEKDCLKELAKIRKEKKELINMLDEANKQAGSILSAKTKK
jgi:hypothetical protein